MGWVKEKKEKVTGTGKEQIALPPASSTISIAARQAVFSLSQQDLNWGPSP